MVDIRDGVLPADLEIADRLPEEIFWLLLIGELPTEEETKDFQAELSAVEPLPEYILNVMKTLPGDSHPMAMLSLGIMCLEQDSRFRQRYNDGMTKFDYWEPALEQFEELGDEALVANLQGNVGAIYLTTGKYVEAMELFLPALKMAEELNDSTRISTLLLNIGVIYSESPATYDEALSYYLRAIEMGEALGDRNIIGISTINLGQVYVSKEEYDSALYYFEKSLTILTGGIDIASVLNSMASIYSQKGEYSKALTLHRDALDLARKENGQRETVATLLGMASTYENLEQKVREGVPRFFALYPFVAGDPNPRSTS